MHRLGVPPSEDILPFVQSQEATKRIELEKIIVQIEKEARENLQLQEGCVETLLSIQKHKIPCAIITKNNREGVQDFLNLLEKCNVSECKIHFDTILTREDGKKFCKPSPDGILYICKTWNFDPCNVLVVGDHLHDLQAGNDAGCSTCLLLCDDPVNHQFKESATFTIQNFSELLTRISSN